jgi:hypothetical protein
MAAGSTYTPIATTTLGSAAASYTFSSIPSTYTDLVLISSLQNTASFVDAYVQVGNGSVDTGTNYSSTILTGNGTSASSTRQTSATAVFMDYNGAPPVGGSFNACVTQFMNYNNTTTYKTWLHRANNAASGGGTDAIVGLWRSTSAINTIKIFISGSNIATGSTLTLYGIASA